MCGIVERQRMLWWENDAELLKWLEQVFAVRCRLFINACIDLGVYRWGKMAKVESTKQSLRFPSQTTTKALQLNVSVSERD